MAPVQLYVYDLSRGMAKSMSLALTGKQIDGIWHTSVVVFGRETFFGQGILHSVPGKTHHGAPVQILDMGETQLDEETFNEYIESMAEEYTAEKYHLMEFNCNHFTADVVGFLTGGTIPEWISGLPAEFLATPFGQQLRPMIDQMFRGRSSTEHRVNPSAGLSTSALPTPPATRSGTPSAAASSLLASVAQAASGPPGSSSSPSLKPLTTPLALVTSLSNFNSILSSTTAVIVNFTNTPTCPPCRMIKPIYEALANDLASMYASKGIRFLEVELGMGEGRDIAGRHGVSATPTFQFFRDGKKVEELRGASKRELESKVETFLDECFPRHKHRRVYMPALEHLPIDPIRSSNIPNYAALLGKLEGFAGGADGIRVLKERAVPLLEGKVSGEAERKAVYAEWTQATTSLLGSLKAEETFPVVDLWRVALLQPALVALLTVALSPTSPGPEPISPILSLGAATLQSKGADTPKPFLLTVLRTLTNLLASLPLANLILGSPSTNQSDLISILVDSLLHSDAAVRTAAGGLAINIANWRHRSAKATGAPAEETGEQDWEVEVLSALVEAIGNEADEDVSHRLLVALAQVCYLAPGYEGNLEPLLEVLGAKEVIRGKMAGWKKKDVRKLADEVLGKLI